MNPLDSVRGAITTGFVAALVLSLLIGPTAFGELSLARWLHIVTGITWIGLLYYFNLVQTPFFATAEAPVRSGMVAGGLLNRALWWFRWGAMATFLTGWLIIADRIGRVRAISALSQPPRWSTSRKPVFFARIPRLVNHVIAHSTIPMTSSTAAMRYWIQSSGSRAHGPTRKAEVTAPTIGTW